MLLLFNQIDELAAFVLGYTHFLLSAFACDGRTLMPGLIDAHWHVMLFASNPAEGMGDASPILRPAEPNPSPASGSAIS
ncbi:hypothetical protein CN198_13980 [Sinorhizobium meliloti]|uniref:hypothetical protein n=1 Tax=Rhizobium meliloti TaxID=382 RepID=UPI000FDA77BD|nr:hypothetical protein [Sinorhizobium meliloti]RVH69171.1 hypothetical protein CN198_13980 [Sinorhizobium meliloti]